MFSLFKALIPGALLTWIVSTVIGSSGSSGGFLYIQEIALGSIEFLWSWPLFLAGTGLAWAILLMMD